VRDIRNLLLESDDALPEYGPEAFDADVVMLWDDNGRRVAAGTSYSAPDGYVEADESYAELAEWMDEDP
jgi:CRISP-associated protein Cas1